MKILALDRSAADAAHLEDHCHAILGGRLERFATAATATAALLANPRQFDAVLLDPAIDDDTGFALLQRGPLLPRHTIIVSARLELAARAFDCGALDFVAKPIARDRLAQALLRAAPLAAADRQFLAVRRFGRIELLPVDDLLYVEGSDKYSELVLNNGQRSFHDKCLGRLEASLPRSFVRIHKSYLVRFPMVSRLLVKRGSRYFAVLKNGQSLPVGRSRYAAIKSRLI